jgi:DNA-binding response OmpR family regulator
MEQARDKTVLVVDDEPNVREYLRTVLEDAEFNVVTAADGEEALEVIHRDRPDFISLQRAVAHPGADRHGSRPRRDGQG